MATKFDIKKLLEPPCDACGAKCCRYVSIEIDKPTGKRDYDTIRWYLLHRNVNVYIDHEEEWFVEFITPCEELRPANRCGAYEERPQVCRDHGWPIGTCEFFDDPTKHYFTSAADFEAYLAKKNIDWRWKRRPRTAKA